MIGQKGHGVQSQSPETRNRKRGMPNADAHKQKLTLGATNASHHGGREHHRPSPVIPTNDAIEFTFILV
jgi:hypothetical protein